jgi:predicted RNA binding protein YcfA (HicA-like mRNA interferase family)
MDSREVIRALSDDGWVLARIKGSHHHFAHPVKSGVVTVPTPAKT